MAERYQPGEIFARFLEDLPRIMLMQQQMELSERRLDIADRKSMADEQYRTEALADRKKQQELDEFTLIYNATESADVKNMLLKQHPTVKNNPALLEQIQTSFEGEQSLKDQVFGLSALPASERMLVSRKLVNNPSMTSSLFKLVKDAEKEGREELQFTMKELGETEAGVEYAQLVHKFENPEQYIKGDTDVNAFMNTISEQLRAVRGEGLKEYRESYGAYPELEDISDNEIDDLLDNI